MNNENLNPQMLVAGRVGVPRGLRGEVTLELRTDDPQSRFARGAELSTDSTNFPSLTVQRLNLHGRRATVQFAEVQTREAAEELRGTELLVPEQLDEAAWYQHQLVGLKVVTPEGEPRGTVVDLKFGAAHEQLVVDFDGREIRVPFVTAIVPTVDIAGGQIIVDAPEGLFEDEQIG